MGTEKKEKRKYEFNGKQYDRQEYVRLVRADKKEKLRKYREGKWFFQNWLIVLIFLINTP